MSLLTFFKCLIPTELLILILNLWFTDWQLSVINKSINYFHAWFDLNHMQQAVFPCATLQASSVWTTKTFGPIWQMLLRADYTDKISLKNLRLSQSNFIRLQTLYHCNLNTEVSFVSVWKDNFHKTTLPQTQLPPCCWSKMPTSVSSSLLNQ